MIKYSPNLVKRALASHSAVGLSAGVFLYLICLTGTLVVFATEFERWQQPEVQEYKQLSTAAMAQALEQYQQRLAKPAEQVYIVLPNRDLPRSHISADGQEWWLNQDGSFAQQVNEGWAHFLREFHYYLHLPHDVGMILVSILGVMLISLILSGIVSHPSIFKDAFQLRLGGSRRLEQTDIHNRLSVWGLPFHLMIAVTGAFFGLVGPLVMTIAHFNYEGNPQTVWEQVYGGDPVIENAPTHLDIDTAFRHLAQHQPEATPIYFVAHKLGTQQQYMEIAATLPGRLIYSEMYRYSAEGNFLGHQQLSDGPVGRQIAYSVYRLHFGQFGGLEVKFLYFFLGLALTAVCVSGINIWLAKSARSVATIRAWNGIVWGTPLALSMAAIANLIADLEPTIIFSVSLLVALIFCLKNPQQHQSNRLLRLLTTALIILLVIGYGFIHPEVINQSHLLVINGALLLLAMVLILADRPLQRFSKPVV